jgi:uncharacterized protein
MYKRSLTLQYSSKESYFLWGPRQSGKSTFLRNYFPDSLYYDLLLSTEYRRILKNPEIIKQEFQSLYEEEKKIVQPIIIDEIQKIPEVLDLVQWMIVNYGARFILCGSSARKLKRGHGNLLGGRALRAIMHPLSYIEVTNFDINIALNRGLLPKIYSSDYYKELLKSYVGDYLKEEVFAESLVRNIIAFSDFLDKVALTNGEIINYNNIARECGVSAPAVKEYYQILVDTLLGYYIPAFTKTKKRRAIHSPKFYLFDVGVVNILAKRGDIIQGSELFGKAFENFILMELIAYSDYSCKNFNISYWRSASGIEVDFIIDERIAIEIKSTSQINSHHTKNIRLLQEESLFQRYIIISFDKNKRITNENIEIFPWELFLKDLWNNAIV